MAYVQIDSLVKSFGDTEILHGIGLGIEKEEFAVFVGPSGCGKTTLLRLIAGLEEVTSGSIRIGDQRVDKLPPAKRGVAMVFQNYALYPHMSVYENMAFGLRIAKVAKALIQGRVKEAAGILQIGELLERKPRALSGGQRQRVAIGLAIVREPKVFLFDEPLSNLDAALRVQMRIEIAKLHRDLKATIIYVTHDQIEAMTMASRIVVLNAGVIEQVGAPLELYHHPANKFVAGFIGSPKMNFLPGTLLSADAKTARVALRDGTEIEIATDATRGAAGSEVTVGIRPEHMLHVSDATPGVGRVRGEVILVENLGESALIYVRIPDIEGLTLCRVEGMTSVKEGETVSLGLPADVAHLFDADGKSFPRKGGALSDLARRAS